MSELRVDTINDAAGTGAPDLANGITIAGGSTLSTYSTTTADLTVGTTDFSTGTLSLTKIGNMVTITTNGTLIHSNSSTPNSDTGVIPVAYRPTSQNVYQLVAMDASRLCMVIVNATNGRFSLNYYNVSAPGFALDATTSSPVGGQLTFSYVIN